MSRNLRPESAKIIPFPLKSRGSALKAPPPGRPAAKTEPAIEWGSSWYHQSAIDEASRDRKP